MSIVSGRRRHRGLLVLATMALVGLGGCAPSTPVQYVISGKTYRMGTDVACLERQAFDFHEEFIQAVSICGAKVPDLTGDGKLQEVAWSWNIPFSIRPVADAAIKKHFPYTPTGSLIANVAPDRQFIGGPYE